MAEKPEVAKRAGIAGPFVGAMGEGPRTLTLLPSYRCNAECRECCFECSPTLHQRIPQGELLQYIDEAADAFPKLKLVVISGGEPFLLGKDLTECVGQASGHGLIARCVTNGFWAGSSERAKRRLEELKCAGLTELNMSTGDDHQVFVPFDRVVNAVIAAAELGLRVVLAIEGALDSKFGLSSAYEHPRLGKWLRNSDAADRVVMLRNVWMPFHRGSNARQSDDVCQRFLDGCPHVLDNLVITPKGDVAACCGLAMEHIPEMKLGNLRERRLKDMYLSQFDDFLKLWLAVDGPKKILRILQDADPTLTVDSGLAHICHACVVLHQDLRIRDLLMKVYPDKIDDVLLRYHLRRGISLRVEAEMEDEPQLGFGA